MKLIFERVINAVKNCLWIGADEVFEAMSADDEIERRIW